MDFKFATKFPNLVQADFDNAYDDVSIQFSGILELWADMATEVRDAKRLLCINYLVAWYLADMYPAEVIGISSDGGKPLSSKSIGGTSLSFKDVPCPPGLEQFTTNTFGMEALRMILSAPERWQIYG
jgi:hypothetical protein